jgi:hypothetical protein
MSNCNCSKNGGDFDARAAFEALSRKHSDLADTVVRYMSEANLKRSERAANALEMAEFVATSVGGILTPEFPECSLLRADGICSGVLIHPLIVLTAGHCRVMGNDEVLINCRDANDPERESIPALTGYPHEFHTVGAFDIQMIFLAKSAQKVAPVRIAEPAEIAQANQVGFVGFGESETGAGRKRAVRLEIQKNSTYPRYNRMSEFIAGGNGKGACRGDSGGPAYIFVNGERKLAGLHSRQMTANCGDGGVYTRVDVYMQWLHDTAKRAHIVFP